MRGGDADFDRMVPEVREGAPPEPRVTQLAHPVVGVVAAAADVAVAPPPPAGAPPMAPPAAD